MAKSQIVLRVLVIAIYNWYLNYQQFETTSDTHVAMEEMTDERTEQGTLRSQVTESSAHQESLVFMGAYKMPSVLMVM